MVVRCQWSNQSLNVCRWQVGGARHYMTRWWWTVSTAWPPSALVNANGDHVVTASPRRWACISSRHSMLPSSPPCIHAHKLTSLLRSACFLVQLKCSAVHLHYTVNHHSLLVEFWHKCIHHFSFCLLCPDLYLTNNHHGWLANKKHWFIYLSRLFCSVPSVLALTFPTLLLF